jgi:hypothetical protein
LEELKMSKVEFYANKGERYQPYVDIIGHVKTDEKLKEQVTHKSHTLREEFISYEDLCWELAEYQLIFEKGQNKYSEKDVIKRAKEIFNSNLNYRDICWLVSSFRTYLKENKLFP